jgi:hypothetical protein
LWYVITISGESYFYSSYTAVVTPYDGPYYAGTTSGGGNLYVRFFNSSGTNVAPAAGFQFAVFKY